jgi:hypothetical protein
LLSSSAKALFLSASLCALACAFSSALCFALLGLLAFALVSLAIAQSPIAESLAMQLLGLSSIQQRKAMTPHMQTIAPNLVNCTKMVFTRHKKAPR